MKDDKKKFIVLGALVAVILGVGAFSFLGGGSTPPPAAEASKTDKAKEGDKVAKVDADGNPIVDGDGAEPPKNPLYAMDLPQRDPFAEGSLANEKGIPGLPDPGRGPQTAPTPAPSRPVRKSGGGRSMEIPPYRPGGLTGQLPGVGSGTVSIDPTAPDTSSFSYSLSGTMNGAKKVAVFTDTNGNQRMVPEGGSLDGDSKVVAIDKGSVTIEHRGKKQRVSLGGNPK